MKGRIRKRGSTESPFSSSFKYGSLVTFSHWQTKNLISDLWLQFVVGTVQSVWVLGFIKVGLLNLLFIAGNFCNIRLHAGNTNFSTQNGKWPSIRKIMCKSLLVLWHSEDRASWYILIIKTNEMHLPEKCRILFQNKFEKWVHLVGFYYKNFACTFFYTKCKVKFTDYKRKNVYLKTWCWVSYSRNAQRLQFQSPPAFWTQLYKKRTL